MKIKANLKKKFPILKLILSIIKNKIITIHAIIINLRKKESYWLIKKQIFRWFGATVHIRTNHVPYRSSRKRNSKPWTFLCKWLLTGKCWTIDHVEPSRLQKPTYKRCWESSRSHCRRTIFNGEAPRLHLISNLHKLKSSLCVSINWLCYTIVCSFISPCFVCILLSTWFIY